MKTLVAMSGGVDSAVAAALMVEAGHEVIGATLKLWQGPNGEAPSAGCCTVSDAEDARRVAAQLDIPYYVFDYTDDFRSGVVDPFVESYMSGQTPNPCVECNRTVKFSRLLDQAGDLGCDLLVTGHYAQVREDPAGWKLLRGVDPGKDQSYVLYMLGQSELARVRFPIGAMTKTETRSVAARCGLRTATKKESQDICFVGVGDYRSFLDSQTEKARATGPIVDHDGTYLGDHDGVSGFTVGQRKGLGVSVGEARYVTSIDSGSATVVLGRHEDLLASGARLESVSWVRNQPPSPGRVEVKIRYNSPPVPAVLEPDGPACIVWFEDRQPSVAPGQAGVIYRGDEVLGGGTIVRALH
ncbi:MAG: tRNA 2-thiouridine(34) synthase MnmA [Acidimicrobiia bacterium]|nr:tRNA 2-thiouridine(34) synthase MnmA [Acidimicrobiia bacterium]